MVTIVIIVKEEADNCDNIEKISTYSDSFIIMILVSINYPLECWCLQRVDLAD